MAPVSARVQNIGSRILLHNAKQGNVTVRFCGDNG
jgi:hypothetical protein